MPYATNPIDGVRTNFEDSGRAATPVLFYTGFADPLEVAKASPQLHDADALAAVSRRLEQRTPNIRQDLEVGRLDDDAARDR